MYTMTSWEEIEVECARVMAIILNWEAYSSSLKAIASKELILFFCFKMDRYKELVSLKLVPWARKHTILYCQFPTHCSIVPGMV